MTLTATTTTYTTYPLFTVLTDSTVNTDSIFLTRTQRQTPYTTLYTPINMPSALPISADASKKADALVQIATAVCNVHGIAHKITDFSKVVFGEQATEDAITARKQELAEHLGQNGSFGEGGACSAMLRASRHLRESLNSSINADELDKLAEAHFGRDVVSIQREVIDVEAL